MKNTYQVGADAHVGEGVLEYEGLEHEGDEDVEDAGDGDDVEGEEVQLGPLRPRDEHVPGEFRRVPFLRYPYILLNAYNSSTGLPI